MRVRFSDPGFEFGEERGRERLEAKSRSLTVSSLSQRGPLDEFVEGGFGGGRRRGVAEGEIGVDSHRSRVDGERKSLPLQRLRRDLVREGSERRKESTGVELLLFLGEHRPNVLLQQSVDFDLDHVHGNAAHPLVFQDGCSKRCPPRLVLQHQVDEVPERWVLIPCRARFVSV